MDASLLLRRSTSSASLLSSTMVGSCGSCVALFFRVVSVLVSPDTVDGDRHKIVSRLLRRCGYLGVRGVKHASCH